MRNRGTRYTRRLGSGAAVTTLALIAAGSTATHSTALAVATRYANPSGTDTACTKAQPCGIVEAINNASGGAGKVVIEPGPYGKNHPIDVPLINSSGEIHIQGQAGKPVPVIYSSANEGLAVDDPSSTLSRVEVIYTGQGTAITSVGQGVDHVIAVASAQFSAACSVYPILTDSLCIATGDHGNAYDINSSGTVPYTATYVIRGVTAIATGEAVTRSPSVAARPRRST